MPSPPSTAPYPLNIWRPKPYSPPRMAPCAIRPCRIVAGPDFNTNLSAESGLLRDRAPIRTSCRSLGGPHPSPWRTSENLISDSTQITPHRRHRRCVMGSSPFGLRSMRLTWHRGGRPDPANLAGPFCCSNGGIGPECGSIVSKLWRADRSRSWSRCAADGAPMPKRVL